MKIYLALIVLVIMTVGCNKPSKSIRITILLDHQISEKKLVDNDTLTKLIEPFYYHDTLIAPIINFERIDVTPSLRDSIRYDGIMKTLNEWMSGNKKNAQKIEKQLNMAIKKFSFNNEFLAPSNSRLSTDSVFVNRYKINAIIFTNLKANYSWVSSKIKVFDTINYIHDYLGDLVLDNNSDIKQVYIYYNPVKLIELDILKITTAEGVANDRVAKVQEQPKGNNEKNNSEVKTPKFNGTGQQIESTLSDKINTSYDEFYNKNNEDDQIIYFFLHLFSENNNPDFKNSKFLSITKEVARLLIDKFPYWSKNGRLTAYSTSCSYKSSFLSAVNKYLPDVDYNKLAKSFELCHFQK